MKTFDVRMRCIVTKSVTVECESEEQARREPFEYALDEIETDQLDWEVTSVREIP